MANNVSKLFFTSKHIWLASGNAMGMSKEDLDRIEKKIDKLNKKLDRDMVCL